MDFERLAFREAWSRYSSSAMPTDKGISADDQVLFLDGDLCADGSVVFPHVPILIKGRIKITGTLVHQGPLFVSGDVEGRAMGTFSWSEIAGSIHLSEFLYASSHNDKELDAIEIHARVIIDDGHSFDIGDTTGMKVTTGSDGSLDDYDHTYEDLTEVFSKESFDDQGCLDFNRLVKQLEGGTSYLRVQS